MHVCVSFVINIFGGLNFHHFIGENGEHGPDAYVSFRTPPLRGGVPGLGWEKENLSKMEKTRFRLKKEKKDT